MYEDWYLLGEEDTRWDDFRSEKKAEKTLEKQIRLDVDNNGQAKKHGSESNAKLHCSIKSGNWSFSRSYSSISKWTSQKDSNSSQQKPTSSSRLEKIDSNGESKDEKRCLCLFGAT